MAIETDRVLDARVGLINSSQPPSYENIVESKRHIIDSLKEKGLEYEFADVGESSVAIYKFVPKK